jgi:hypothetical protein
VDWANEFGTIEHAGVEGTGSFGAGLARFLKTKGIEVREVIPPSAETSTAAANLILSMLKRRLGRCWRAPQPAGPKMPTATWR